jgi:hypothetical protein
MQPPSGIDVAAHISQPVDVSEIEAAPELEVLSRFSLSLGSLEIIYLASAPHLRAFPLQFPSRSALR